MKHCKWILTALMVAGLTMVGCSKKSGVDTAPLEKSFKSAEPAAQSSVEKAVSAIKSADYVGAVTELQKLAMDAKLTPEQQQAVQGLIAQLQKAIAETASKAAGEAGKALDDAKKALPK